MTVRLHLCKMFSRCNRLVELSHRRKAENDENYIAENNNTADWSDYDDDVKDPDYKLPKKKPDS